VGLAAECYYGNFRPWMGDYRFSGTLHPNTQGLNLAVLCCSAFCLARRDGTRTSPFWLLLALGLAAVILTKSRTSTAGILAALGSIWLLQASWRVRIVTIGGGLGLAALALFAVLASGWDYEHDAQQAVLLGREEQTESLTGRLPIWFELIDQIGHRPWHGHGYDTFWTADNIEMVSERIEWPAKEGHNGYLDLTLSIGLVGAGLVVLTALAGLVQAAFAYDASGDPAYGLAAGLLVFGLLNCFLESGMAMPQFPPFLAACALAQLAHVSPAPRGRGAIPEGAS
jgi:O-antigen ligase